MRKYLLFLFAFGISFSSFCREEPIQSPSKILSGQKQIQNARKITKFLKLIPVQDRGRIKPFDTFARETVDFISSSSFVKNKSSVHIVITWILMPDVWDKMAFVWVPEASVKKALELDIKKEHFSPVELGQNKFLQSEIDELKTFKEKEKKRSPYWKAVQKLENRLMLYQAIRQGYLPVWREPLSKKWLSARQLNGDQKQKFIQLLTSYSLALSSGQLDNFIQAVKDYSPPPELKNKMKQEAHYHSLKPFRWAWIFYLLGLISFAGLILYPVYQKYITGSFFIIAVIFNIYGIILRSYIMSRPPVSNMFETLLWVPLAGMALALIFSLVKKRFFPVLAGAVCAFFCLFLSDMSGAVLNDKLEPLEAVLRSNFWLSTHVLIITMSYSAFFLAFIMGDFLTFQFLRGKTEKHCQPYLWFLYRTLQVGVLLLAFGTILGGIWADYSWGRFWGWDPKEVWALVSLLGYLALLHARIQGWIEGFGLALGSIYCFFLIIMTWYGVNFVLGKGLHSYGFGQGGLAYVSAFVGLHIVFLFTAWRWKARQKHLKA